MQTFCFLVIISCSFSYKYKTNLNHMRIIIWHLRLISRIDFASFIVWRGSTIFKYFLMLTKLDMTLILSISSSNKVLYCFSGICHYSLLLIGTNHMGDNRKLIANFFLKWLHISMTLTSQLK